MEEGTPFQTADDEHHFFEPADSGGSIFEEDRKSTIQRGQMIYHVKDHGLAVCLVSCGIPLREDPPYISVDLGTEEAPNIVTVYNFLPSDEAGELETGKCIEAWLKGDEFMEGLPSMPRVENGHPPLALFGAAKATWMNVVEFQKHHSEKSKVFFAYAINRNGKPAHYLVIPGSKRHRLAEARKLRRITKPRTS